MTTAFVEFFDAAETIILSVFSCPQDINIYPNQAAISTSDNRYASFYNGLPPIGRAGLPAPG
ncbi:MULTISPECIES: hypothetical protein [Burkholderia cepacia complex]|uniref:Uncharacterized protein n=1 Tax=Burkholderia stabilis TaxID=95485 RepID=A0AAJ5N3P6_9BURK|nr:MULTISPECIES: hypothetical protein [Burkholderia cepacia complex]MBR8188301.1 hypothetical protein [Burkholderia vietnamiensis]VBB10615.1 hypothetical protein BSTAB16_0722 [Burkholderia stabilis]